MTVPIIWTVEQPLPPGGTVSFADETDLKTTVTFSNQATGTYILKLADQAGEFEPSTAYIQVGSEPGPEGQNAGPVVNPSFEADRITAAITDGEWSPTAIFSVYGNISDDGRPDGVLNVTWSATDLDSDGGTATFGSCHAEDTTVTFSKAGSYALTVVADDGDKQKSGVLYIDLVGSRPRVDAGDNQTIDVSQNAVTLDGSETSVPGTPYPQGVDPVWSVTVPPGGWVEWIGSVDDWTPQVRLVGIGDFIFQLDAVDQQGLTAVPDSVHSWKRRWHVLLGGYRSGRSAQGAPVRNTQRMPLRTARKSCAGRPDLPGPDFAFGMYFLILCHCSFVRSMDLSSAHKTTYH
jgi:hypothetical protein